MGSVISNIIYSYFMRNLETNVVDDVDAVVDDLDDISCDANVVGDYYNLYMYIHDSEEGDVNADLKKHHVGQFITTVPCLYDSKYDGMSSEEVYDHLYENAEKLDLDSLIDRLLDDHMDGDGSKDQDTDGNGRPKLSDEERAKIRDEIKEAMLSAAQTSEAGNIPLGVRRLIKDLTEPVLNWRELLRLNIESTVKSDFSWMKASRRGWHIDAIMPGMRNDEMIDIAVFIDASGSIDSNMLKDFLSEIQGIMDQFQTFKIHLVTFDTETYNPVTYTSDNLDTICDYEVTGGGGTEFDCIFDYLKREEIEPKRLVVFTDGYPFGSWGDENYADTLWILHGTKTIVPPWGQFAYYEQPSRS